MADPARLMGGDWQARCSAHEDRIVSLSIGEGDDGPRAGALPGGTGDYSASQVPVHAVLPILQGQRSRAVSNWHDGIWRRRECLACRRRGALCSARVRPV
jgi:hypothetical protein